MWACRLCYVCSLEFHFLAHYISHQIHYTFCNEYAVFDYFLFFYRLKQRKIHYKVFCEFVQPGIFWEDDLLYDLYNSDADVYGLIWIKKASAYNVKNSEKWLHIISWFQWFESSDSFYYPVAWNKHRWCHDIKQNNCLNSCDSKNISFGQILTIPFWKSPNLT